jgi:hypothetical protein
MLSDSSRTHSNQPSEETLPDAEETPSLKANDYDKNKLASMSVTSLYNVLIILYITLPFDVAASGRAIINILFDLYQ